jgi:hypothetical protein
MGDTGLKEHKEMLINYSDCHHGTIHETASHATADGSTRPFSCPVVSVSLRLQTAIGAGATYRCHEPV